jgi:16S rRNA (guanine527-N7)-methyltransferase
MIAGEADALLWIEGLPHGDASALARLEQLVVLLAEENALQNLVSAASLDEIWRRHFADSAQLLLHAPQEPAPWLDLGSGAGFPGLVIAILRPDARVVMVESRKRRVDWLERMVQRLDLRNAEVLGCRLEDVVSSDFRTISARAFASLPKLLDLSARFSTSETCWLLPKGRSAAQELQELKGWKHMFHVKQSLTDADAGIIVGKLLGRKDRGQ